MSDLIAETCELRCECGHVEPLTAETFARYLAGGWPVHCGSTMPLQRFRPRCATCTHDLAEHVGIGCTHGWKPGEVGCRCCVRPPSREEAERVRR